MTINTKRTEGIFFGNKAHLKKLDNKTVRYLDTPLKRKDKVKYLGAPELLLLPLFGDSSLSSSPDLSRALLRVSLNRSIEVRCTSSAACLLLSCFLALFSNAKAASFSISLCC